MTPKITKITKMTDTHILPTNINKPKDCVNESKPEIAYEAYLKIIINNQVCIITYVFRLDLTQ